MVLRMLAINASAGRLNKHPLDGGTLAHHAGEM
jgi:hypothetical protein